jgi:glutaredoxin-related protein
MNIRDKVKKYQNWPNGEVFVMGSDVASKTERIMTEETKNRV